MEEIIKKAIEGGYKENHIWGYEGDSNGNKYIIVHGDSGQRVETIPIKYIFLDPLFWQALGKACGWERVYVKQDNGVEVLSTSIAIKRSEIQEKWLNIAILFHEINLTEGMEKAIEYLKSIVVK